MGKRPCTPCSCPLCFARLLRGITAETRTSTFHIFQAGQWTYYVFCTSSMLTCIAIPLLLACRRSDNVVFPYRPKRRTREHLSWSRMTFTCWKHYRRLTSWSAKKPSSTSISSSEKIYCLQAKTSHQARSRKHSPNCRLMMIRSTPTYTVVQNMAVVGCLCERHCSV